MIFSCWRMLVLSLLDVCLRLAPQNITWFDFKQEQINFRHGVGVLHFLWLPLQIFLSILLCLDFLIHKIKIKITAFGLIFEIKKNLQYLLWNTEIYMIKFNFYTHHMYLMHDTSLHSRPLPLYSMLRF